VYYEKNNNLIKRSEQVYIYMHALILIGH